VKVGEEGVMGGAETNALNISQFKICKNDL